MAIPVTIQVTGMAILSGTPYRPVSEFIRIRERESSKKSGMAKS